jgi:hypothetical protein
MELEFFAGRGVAILIMALTRMAPGAVTFLARSGTL